jgi:hypothetical protein
MMDLARLVAELLRLVRNGGSSDGLATSWERRLWKEVLSETVLSDSMALKDLLEVNFLGLCFFLDGVVGGRVKPMTGASAASLSLSSPSSDAGMTDGLKALSA